MKNSLRLPVVVLGVLVAVLAVPGAVLGQSLRLHTPSLASPTSASYVVSFDGQGQPLPPTSGTFPAAFQASWQFPGPSVPYGLRISPSMRYAFVGGASDDAVVLADDSKAALTNGNFLDSSGNYIAGAVRSPVISATPTREGRYLLALDSTAKSAIALVEIGVEGGKPTIRSAYVKATASLNADTFGVLGAGISFASDMTKGTIVVGDAVSTLAFLYNPANSGSRFSAPDTIPNPAGFHYIGATSAGTDGAFWVVGVNGSFFELRYLDTTTRTWDNPVAKIARTAGDVLVPAFDPYDPSRMLLIVSKVGGTPAFILTGLARGVDKGTLSPTAANGSFDFSASPAFPPAVLVPAPNAARGYLLGRVNGESAERLYPIDLTTGVMSASSVVFGAARHQTLILEKPDQAPQSLSIKADSSGAVSGGQNATFTVTRTDATAAFTALYSTVDGTAKAGRDFDGAAERKLEMGAGRPSESFSIPIRKADGCVPERSFTVKLTNTNATLTNPNGVSQKVASTVDSEQCSFTITPPPAVDASQTMIFKARRGGTDRDGAVSAPVTATAGNTATTSADFSLPVSTISFQAANESADIAVITNRTADCAPAKAVTVTIPAAVQQPGRAATTATGSINAVSTGCTVTATVTGPERPYLPADEVEVKLSEVTAGRFDLAKATWTVTAIGDTDFDQLSPTGPQAAGSALRVRFKSDTSGSATGTATGSVKVTYFVPPLAGQASPPPAATGSLTLDPVAAYPDLVRMDGPAQYSIPAAAKRRYSLIWGAGYRNGEGDQLVRPTTWLNPKVDKPTEKKSVRWSYCTSDPCSNVTRVPVVCEAGGGSESCVLSLPSTGVARIVAAEVKTGDSTWRVIAELPVKGVEAPATSGLKTVRYVPVALEWGGVKPAFFETELTLVNGTERTVVAELAWNGITQKEIVGAGRQLVINGLVESLRETKPDLGTGVGPLMVTFRGLAWETDQRLVGVIARTTTEAGIPGVYRRTGRAGLAYRGIRHEELLGGAEGQSKAAWLIGLRGTNSDKRVSVDRSNLAVTKPDPNEPEALVDVTLYDNDGLVVKSMPGQKIASFTQWELFKETGGKEVGFARVEWKSGGAVTTYATPVNNASADGSFVFPVREDLAAAKTSALLAPVLFESPSDVATNDFTFLADAALTSTKGATNTVLDYFWSGGGTGGTTRLTRIVPGQTILGATQTPGVKPLGVVEELRKVPGSTIPARANGQLVIGMGLVRRTDNATFVPGDLMAGTRVDGPTTGDRDASKYGRFGIFLPAVPLSNLKDLPELRILGLRQDKWVRSNLALVNPGDQTVALKVELHVTKPDGTAVTVPAAGSCGSFPVADGVVSLPAYTFCQISTVLAGVNANSGYAVIYRAGDDAAAQDKTFYAYGVANDGTNEKPGTNDGAYLLAELASCGDLGISIVDPTAVVNRVFPTATFNAPYPQNESLMGGASPTGRSYHFVASGLPTGMNLVDSSDRWYLAGTPTVLGTSADIKVTATDRAGCKSARTYSLTVANCGVSLNPAQESVGQTASTPPGKTFEVNPNGDCKWTAVSRNSWLHVTNGSPQSGKQNVSYTWDASPIPSRTGTIDIVLEGQTTAAATFTLTQTAACTYTYDPPVNEFCQTGGTKTVIVQPSATTCTGTLASDSSWITLGTTQITGQPVTVTLTVDEMPTDQNKVREGLISVTGSSGNPHTVRQTNLVPLIAGNLNGGAVCQGGEIRLTATGAIQGAEFYWTGPGGFTSQEQNPTVTDTADAGARIYSVIQRRYGCTSSPSTTTVTVNPRPAISSVPARLPDGVYGADYGPVTYSNSNGATSTSYAVTGLSPIPPGLTLTPAGVLSGQPSQVGDFNFTVTATDSNGCVAPRSESVSVSKGNATVAITGSTPDPSSVGQLVTVTVRVVGGLATPTGSVTVNAPGASNPGGCLINLALGEGSCTGFAYPVSGTFTISATYSGDNNYVDGSSTSQEHTVSGRK